VPDDPIKFSLFSSGSEGDVEDAHTGAKNLENGTPPLRAKAQSCRDAAAREAMPDAVVQAISTLITNDVATWL
jgi:hypothetical protein